MAELDSEARSSPGTVNSIVVPIRSRPSEWELVLIAREGDSWASDRLTRRFVPFLREKASSYLMTGSDPKKLLEAGLVGLHSAMKLFRPDRGSSFHSFAELCITREMIREVHRESQRRRIEKRKGAGSRSAVSRRVMRHGANRRESGPAASRRRGSRRVAARSTGPPGDDDPGGESEPPGLASTVGWRCHLLFSPDDGAITYAVPGRCLLAQFRGRG